MFGQDEDKDQNTQQQMPGEGGNDQPQTPPTTPNPGEGGMSDGEGGSAPEGPSAPTTPGEGEDEEQQ